MRKIEETQVSGMPLARSDENQYGSPIRIGVGVTPRLPSAILA
jgi:hypothetical protein